MTSKSDEMAASEFNITRIKEIQAMFAKGEVSFERLDLLQRLGAPERAHM